MHIFGTHVIAHECVGSYTVSCKLYVFPHVSLCFACGPLSILDFHDVVCIGETVRGQDVAPRSLRARVFCLGIFKGAGSRSVMPGVSTYHQLECLALSKFHEAIFGTRFALSGCCVLMGGPIFSKTAWQTFSRTLQISSQCMEGIFRRDLGPKGVSEYLPRKGAGIYPPNSGICRELLTKNSETSKSQTAMLTNGCMTCSNFNWESLESI